MILLIKQLTNQRLIYHLIIFFSLLIILFIHLQTALFSLVIYILVSFFYLDKNYKHQIPKLIIIFIFIVLIYVIYSLDSSNLNLTQYLINYYTTKYFKLSNLLSRLQIISINDNYHWGEEPIGTIISIIINLILFLPLIIIIFIRKKLKIRLNKNDFGGSVIKISILFSLILYFLLPSDIPEQNFIFQRFTIFIWLGLIALFSRFIFDIKYFSKYKIILIFSLILFQIMVFEYFISFQKECKNFTPDFFKEIKQSERVYGLFFDSEYRGRPIFIHFHNYFTIWNKGISGGIVDYRFSLIKRKTDINKLPAYNPWAGNLEQYNNEYSDVEYILSRNEDCKQIDNFIISKKDNKWILYKNSKMNNK